MNVKLYITLIIVLVSFCQSNGQRFNIGIALNSFRDDTYQEDHQSILDSYQDENAKTKSSDYNIIVEGVENHMFVYLSFQSKNYVYERTSEVFANKEKHISILQYGYHEKGGILLGGYIDTVGSFVIRGGLGLLYGIVKNDENNYQVEHYLEDGSLDKTLRNYYTLPEMKKYGLNMEVSVSKLLFSRFAVGVSLKNHGFYGVAKGQYEYKVDQTLSTGNIFNIKTDQITVKDQSFRFANFTYGLQLVYNIYNLK